PRAIAKSLRHRGAWPLPTARAAGGRDRYARGARRRRAPTMAAPDQRSERSRVAVRERRELALPELPLREGGVRDHEPRIGDGLPLELDDVEIERSRAPALLANAARARLDPLQFVQQGVWFELGLGRDHLVKVRPLPRRTGRLRLP